MKFRIITLLCLAFVTFQANAQRTPPDELATSKGPLSIQPVQHASLVLSIKGTTLYVDPSGGAPLFKGLAAPDIILITDIHGDHFDTATLDALKTAKSIIIVPQAVADKMSAEDKAQAVILKNGDHTTQAGFSISAIPMYNLPEGPESRHPKGRGNGYVIEIGGKHLYISGDTQGIPEMRALKNIDVAFVCMNLPYTMDVNEATNAVLAFKPKVVYPYHYRGQGGLSDINTFKKQVNEGSKEIEVRLRNWYAQP